MQPGVDKDYRYLLSRLIPRHFLSSRRIQGIKYALDSGDRLKIVGEAYLSLEELVAKGIFTKGGLERSNDNVSVSYDGITKREKITLEMTWSEWNAVGGDTERTGRILPTVLAGIISSLSLNNSQGTVSSKAEEIAALAGHVQRGAKGFLILMNKVTFPVIGDRDGLKVLSAEEIMKNRFYSPFMEGKTPHCFLRLGGTYPGENLFEISPETRSVMLVPVQGEREKLGILELHLPCYSPPTNDIIMNYYLIAQGVARLVENNKHLEERVSIDRLTQVNNRNHYEVQLPLEMERATRNKDYLAFLMIDIDDFKKVNDGYGHDVGDSILKCVAQTIKKEVRKIDLLFRFGGEEFVVLLPGADRDAAERTAERIREVVSKQESDDTSGCKISVTVSIGGCIYPLDAQSEIELLRKADIALYRSKDSGKNRVTFYSPDK